MKRKSGKAPPPAFQPIHLERVSDKIANQLKKAIVEGVFKVGDRLPSERELAEQMGVSRPSVREAIQKLDLRGLVESIQGGGTIVRNFTEQEVGSPMQIMLGEDRRKVVELTEVRALMEAWAAREAAIHRTDRELERIRSFLEEMEGDLEKGRIRSELDFKFHTEIAAAARNTIFLHLMQSIYQLIDYSIRLYREQVFVTKQDQETIFNHHLRIFKAIQNRDPDAAQAAMRTHLLFVVQEFKTRLSHSAAEDA